MTIHTETGENIEAETSPQLMHAQKLKTEFDFLYCTDTHEWRLDIQDDVTPLEAVNLTMVCLCAVTSIGYYNIKQMILDKAIDRHFLVEELNDHNKV